MIYVDDREGSGQLAPLLRQKGMPVHVGRLNFGDVSFLGCGPGGRPVPVGIEVKQLSDVLKCITDGRFAGHQLPGLVESYEEIWLMIEGMWRMNPSSGIMEQYRSGSWREATVGSRRFMYKDLYTWIFTLSTKAQVKVHHASNWGEAIVWLSTLYNWWTKNGKGWEEHHSHVALHRNNSDTLFDRAVLVRPSVCRLVATQLPGIGYDKSATLASFFGTVENLVLASESELAKVPGIGPGIARKVWYSLRNKQ